MARAIEDIVFTERRLWFYGGLVLAAYVGLLAELFGDGRWLLDDTGHPIFVDFVWLWTGAHFALLRDAAGAFDYAVFSAAQAQFVGASRGILPWYHWIYPPTLLLLIAPLGLLSYGAAFLAWVSATLGFYLAAIYAIVPRSVTVLLALVPVAVLENFDLGHTAFLSAGLFGFALALLHRRPFLSGIFLGLLTYKPQLGLLFPVVLAIAGQWRVIAGAVVGAALFATAAIVAFGVDAWLLFARTLVRVDPGYLGPDADVTLHHQTVFGVMQWLGAAPSAAWAVHLAFALAVTVVVCAIWRRPVAPSLQAAALAIGALSVTPYLIFYDLTSLAVPAAFIVRDGMERGFLPGERWALLGCYVALFLPLVALPSGPVILVALLALVVRRARVTTRA